MVVDLYITHVCTGDVFDATGCHIFGFSAAFLV